MSDTPRTSEEWRRIQRLPDGRYSSQVTYEDLAHGMCNFAKQLERQLAEVTKQRDGAFSLIEYAGILLGVTPQEHKSAHGFAILQAIKDLTNKQQ